MKRRSHLAIFIFLILVTIVPLGMGLVYALIHSLGLAGLLASGFTFEFWTATLTGSEVWMSFAYSFFIAATTMVISTVLALGLAVFARQWIQSGWVEKIWHIPLTLPAIVVAFVVFQLASDSGLLSRLFFRMGFFSHSSDFPDLVNDSWGIGIIIAHTWMTIPFLTLYFFHQFQHQNLGRLKQLSESMGADDHQVLVKVTLPVIFYASRPVLVLYFIFVFGSYEIPLLLGQQYPQMASVLIFRKLRKFDLTDIPEAYIMAILFFLMLIALVWILSKWMRHETTYSG